MARLGLILSHIIFSLPITVLFSSGAWALTVNGVTFLNPTEADQTFYYLDTVNVTYLSPFADPRLYTFCDNGLRNPKLQEATPFNGTTSVFLNFTSDTECFFNLRPNSPSSELYGANSVSFILSPLQRNQTTTGLSGSSSTSTPTSASTGTGTPTILPTNESPQGEGMSSGSKAAIGVGVSLSVLGIAGAATSFFLVRRQKQKRKAQRISQSMNGSGRDSDKFIDNKEAFVTSTSSYGGSTYAPTTQTYGTASPQQPRELAAGHVPQELSA